MALSISNSNRSVLVFALTAALFGALALINNAQPDAKYKAMRQEDHFWLHKIYGHSPASQDIVLSGDSRLYRGLSPAIFESVLPDTNVVNYGFSSGGHNPVIFADIDRLLSNDPTRLRAVVLGITPGSLTSKAQTNAQYMDYRRRSSTENTPLSALDDYLRPFNQKRLRGIISGSLKIEPADKSIYEYRDDGWLRTDWIKHEPTSALTSYGHIFDDNKVSPDVINGVLHKTREWRAQGIIVIAYRPPTTPDMVRLENSKSGFDETTFRRDFRAAGGTWVDPGQGYESYDGSHLTPESAEKLSKILATSIAQMAQNP